MERRSSRKKLPRRPGQLEPKGMPGIKTTLGSRALPRVPTAFSVTVSVILRLQYDLAPSVTLLELSISIPNLGQRVDLRDGNLQTSCGKLPSELCEPGGRTYLV